MRRGVVELFVATEPLRDWRCLRVEAYHKVATWVQFVARLMDTTYCQAKKVRWVMDNLSTHKRSFFYAHFPPAVAQAYLRRMDITYPPGPWLVAEHGRNRILRPQPAGPRPALHHWRASTPRGRRVAGPPECAA